VSAKQPRWLTPKCSSKALRRVLQLRSHHPRTLDDTIDVRLPSRKIGCAPHARKICPVERQEREVYP
jgi:hypothetical protein